MRTEILSGLCASLSTSDALTKALHIGIRLYCKSDSFATADTRFDEMIRPSLPTYGREHFVALLQGSETCYNRQATGRGRAGRDHNDVKAVLDLKFPDISVDGYPVFKASIGS